MFGYTRGTYLKSFQFQYRPMYILVCVSYHVHCIGVNFNNNVVSPVAIYYTKRCAAKICENNGDISLPSEHL